MKRDDFRLNRDAEYGSWQLYAADDKEDAEPLLAGHADWVGGDWTRPNMLDFWRAMLALAARISKDGM